MAFFVKNISITSISVHGIILDVNSKVDLTLTVSNADIITSLLSGELFDKITGRALAIVDISTLRTLGATTNELSAFARIGYFQGRLGTEDFKDPFTFNADGYLMTTASIGDITVESQSEVEGRVLDGSSAAGIKPVIIAGVDSDGYAQNIQTDGYGNIIISKASFSDITVKSQSEVEGRALDGASAAGIKPVIIAGVDEAGNAQNLIVNSDGYLMTSTAISIETNSEVEGRVADGASAAGVKPVIIAGVDEAGNAQNLIVNSDGYLMTSTAISVETTSEVEGRVLDGASAAGIKPVIVAGVDSSGFAQNIKTNSYGDVVVSGYSDDNTIDPTYAVKIGGTVKIDPTATSYTDGYKGNVILDVNRRIHVRDASYDSLSAASRNVPVFMSYSNYEPFDLSNTVATDALTSYYIDADTYPYWSCIFTTTNADGYVGAVTVNVSNDSDVADITARSYVDATTLLFGGPQTLSLSNPLVLSVDTPQMFNSYKITVDFNGAAIWTAKGKKGSI